MMNLKLGALLVFALAVVATLQTIRNFRKDKLSTRLLFMWLSIWISIGFFALFPQTIDYIMKYLNFGNRLFFLTTGAILILYIIIFNLSANNVKLSRKISKLSQEIAILKYKIDSNDNRRKFKEKNEKK